MGTINLSDDNDAILGGGNIEHNMVVRIPIEER